MLETYYKDPTAINRLRCCPLGLHLDTFAASLERLGYAKTTIRLKLWLLGVFGRWLGENGLAVSDLEESVVALFFDERRRRHRLQKGHRATIHHLLAFLRAKSAIPLREVTIEESPLSQLENRYTRFLKLERGLRAKTVVLYASFVRCFLMDRFGERSMYPRQLRASDVSSFILRHAHSRSLRWVQVMTTALRSFFRFLFQYDEIDIDLAPSVLSVADWRLSTIPRHLTQEEVARVLKACDRNTAIGRRDYALLLLLARLGLRAGEVVALELDDIDWRTGELIVRGKGLVSDRLPLLADVGEALAAYLQRDRSQSPVRRVFICMKAPRRGFADATTVSTIVRRALERAGLDPPVKGAHLLRHSLATQMLHCGATMAEIGEVLRHRLPSTTEIYAKVDWDGLRSLAQPWPVVGGGQ